MSFAEWITSELEKRGWSRREAARRGGFSPSILDKVINGYSKPGLKFLQGLAKAFEMTLSEIIEIKSQYPVEFYEIEDAYRKAGITKAEAILNDELMTLQEIFRNYRYPKSRENALIELEKIAVQEERGDYDAKTSGHISPAETG